MKKLSVQLDRCTGCKRCETACMAAHSAAGDYVLARFTGEAVAPRLFVEAVPGEKAVPVVCRHCHEALCVSACMAGCMQKDPETGLVSNQGHEQKCVGCWMCIMACPYGVIVPGAPAADPSAFQVAIKCDFCPKRDTPACVEGCPNRAIEVVTEAAGAQA